MNPRRRNLSQRSEMIEDCHLYGVIPDTREIFLTSRFDIIDEDGDSMIDNWSANNFIRNIRLLLSISETEPILVHSITRGGLWNYGIAIYDAIAACPAHVTVLSYAHARSMSSVIPQAADQRVLMPNASFLIHWGSLGVYGNHTSVVHEVEQAKVDSETMLEIYVQRCKDAPYWKKRRMGEASVRRHLRSIMDKKQEVYLTPREAVERGFADGVLGDPGFESIKILRGAK